MKYLPLLLLLLSSCATPQPPAPMRLREGAPSPLPHLEFEVCAPYIYWTEVTEFALPHLWYPNSAEQMATNDGIMRVETTHPALYRAVGR